MIAKISTAANLSDGLFYNLKKVDKHKAYVLCGSSVPFNEDKSFDTHRAEIQEEFWDHLEVLDRAGRTKKPIVHISLNPSPDDNVDDLTYFYIAQEYLREMGFTGQPFIVFKHEDIERHHIHILTTNVRSDGSKINDSFSHRKSVQICQKMERDYELKPAKNSLKEESEKLLPIKHLFSTEKGDTGSQIRQIVRLMNKNYHFESINEYRALSRLFGIEVDFKDAGVDVNGNASKQGIVFYGLDANGNRCTNPLRSFVIEKGLFAKITKKFKMSKSVLTNKTIRESLKHKLDYVKSAHSAMDFYEKLSKTDMDIVFRKNETGRIYGATVIDHDSGAVLNGSKIGKAYSANIFNELFNSFDTYAGGRTQPLHQPEILQELSNITQDSGNITFSGSAGGYANYQHVNEKDKESENDKLNREIQKRKNKKKRLF